MSILGSQCGSKTLQVDRGEKHGNICIILGWLTLLFLVILAWHILSISFPLLIASPYETLTYIITIDKQILSRAITITLINSVTGFLIAMIMVSLIALLSYFSGFFRYFTNALNRFIQSVSVLVWAIIFIMIFGVTSSLPPILVTAMASFPILLSSMMEALNSLELEYYELTKILELSRIKEFRHIILPGSVPYMISASRSALGIALRISVVAEAFGSSGGIGYQLVYSYDLGLKVGVFAWSTLLILLMLVLDQLILGPIERWSYKWR